MEEPFNAYLKQKKPIWKGYVLYDSNYIYNVPEDKNQGSDEKIRGCQG